MAVMAVITTIRLMVVMPFKISRSGSEIRHYVLLKEKGPLPSEKSPSSLWFWPLKGHRSKAAKITLAATLCHAARLHQLHLEQSQITGSAAFPVKRHPWP